ncbi:MAG TPA: malto-oligosyltrehalose trehalohydrolase [Blastocatellia bacterium]|nr:malto-oligosyltrehalose trehalohydrolase [Blastocatellia bacterium]
MTANLLQRDERTITRIGAHYSGEGRCEFAVWAPLLQTVKLRIIHPEERSVIMSRDDRGYWRAAIEGLYPGALYFYQPDGSDLRPDPASNYQPLGVHGPSQVIDHSAFSWTDKDWRGVALEEMIIYEAHVGTFTPEGTFDGLIARLGEIRDIGVNAIEIMPVAQFPGGRNWGYDGAHPFAAQNSYGGPDAMKRLVDACHSAGLSVILDVVYNHLGPEGNYLACFGPYFTDRHKTPWGNAINFDDAHCADVRNYFIENAIHWFGNYHVDALRLDATHAMHDDGDPHILQELAREVGRYSKQQGRQFYLMAENDLNDARVTRPAAVGGYGISAQWCDDFHHSLRALLTGEDGGYFKDFGRVEHLVKAYREGFVYSGEYSEFRGRRYGTSSKEVPGHQLIVFSQNHDQVGNRMLGERLSEQVSFEALKLAAGAVLVSPYVPMLFMGEEYAEGSPFLYFVSHEDEDLIASVRNGRKAEFASFNWQGEPPDPQAPESFLRSKLKWEARSEGRHKVMLSFYKRLIELRRTLPALSHPSKDNLAVVEAEPGLLLLRRWREANHVLCVMNFNKAQTTFRIDAKEREWRKMIDSAEAVWGGPGSPLPASVMIAQELTAAPLSFVLFENTF